MFFCVYRVVFTVFLFSRFSAYSLSALLFLSLPTCYPSHLLFLCLLSFLSRSSLSLHVSFVLCCSYVCLHVILPPCCACLSGYLPYCLLSVSACYLFSLLFPPPPCYLPSLLFLSICFLFLLLLTRSFLSLFLSSICKVHSR